MDQSTIEKVMKEVAAEMNAKECCHSSCGNITDIGLTEFVGTAIGHTYGLVIASIDPMLAEPFNLGKYRSIGIIGARTGAGPQLMAVDEAVKATNTEVITIELPRDTEGGGGHGSLIIVGADDVSDAKRCVEIALDVLPKYFGDVYGCSDSSNHLEFQYTARASQCLNKAFGTPIGKAFGMTCAAPAAIGVVLADVAVKAANVEVVAVSTPKNGGTSFSNEVILAMTGDSGAVRQAVKAAIDAGKQLLGAFGGEVKSTTSPYI
ncbi:MAG: propanediol utilization microcompartment protein PduB [Lachnospiraceae bacterium]|jgi:microcompartment protein PduB|nr:propanediol utilization microcompartment protein PduB [Lachnospiraceae bacterium]